MANWPSTPPLSPPSPARLHPDNTGRTIRWHGAPGCAKVQRTDVPRTCPARSLPLGRYFGVETEGRWSAEAAGFLRQLAHARARQSPEPLRQAVTAALIARWSALLAHATFTALAASLLCEDTSSHNSVDGFLPPRSEVKSSPTCHESPLPPAEPQPPLKEHGLDLATAWRLPSTTVQDRDPAAKRCGGKKKCLVCVCVCVCVCVLIGWIIFHCWKTHLKKSIEEKTSGNFFSRLHSKTYRVGPRSHRFLR